MKYKFIVILYHHWNKNNGYSNWAARVTSTVTGKQWKGIVSHESNILIALTSVFGRSFNESCYLFTIHDMTRKAFREQTADFVPDSAAGSLEDKLRDAFGMPDINTMGIVDWVRAYCNMHPGTSLGDAAREYRKLKGLTIS